MFLIATITIKYSNLAQTETNDRSVQQAFGPELLSSPEYASYHVTKMIDNLIVGIRDSSNEWAPQHDRVVITTRLQKDFGTEPVLENRMRFRARLADQNDGPPLSDYYFLLKSCTVSLMENCLLWHKVISDGNVTE